jgi:hypothetical protein
VFAHHDNFKKKGKKRLEIQKEGGKKIRNSKRRGEKD